MFIAIKMSEAMAWLLLSGVIIKVFAKIIAFLRSVYQVIQKLRISMLPSSPYVDTTCR